MSCPRKFTFGVCVMISTLTAAWPCSQALPLYYHASTSTRVQAAHMAGCQPENKVFLACTVNTVNM